MCELASIALDCFSGKDPIGRSSPKCCSRSARPARTSQVTVWMKREWNWGLEERIRAKEIKTKNIDKFLVDAIRMPSMGHETFII
jgi:hypothetical protein